MNYISRTKTGIGTAIGTQHQQRLRWLLPPLYRFWIAYDQEIDLQDFFAWRFLF
jgi:hypothetical protein